MIGMLFLSIQPTAPLAHKHICTIYLPSQLMYSYTCLHNLFPVVRFVTHECRRYQGDS